MPIPGMHYHIVTHSCDQPGNLALAGRPSEWECGIDFVYAKRNPPLVPGHECMLNETVAYGRFTWQYQGGEAEDGTLTLPHGTGIPVGGKAGPKYIVVSYHFISLNESLPGNMSGVSGLDFKLSRHQPHIKKVGGLTLGAYGFLKASSVGTMTGTWTLTEEKPIQLLRIYTHWHGMAIGSEVSVKAKEGDVDVILKQDPRQYKGYTELADSDRYVMKPGDALTLTCTFNNTKDEIVRVEAEEMCTVTIFYSVDGPEVLSTNVVFSNDQHHKECFTDVPNWGVEINYDGASSYTGPVDHDLCHTWNW